MTIEQITADILPKQIDLKDFKLLTEPKVVRGRRSFGKDIFDNHPIIP